MEKRTRRQVGRPSKKKTESATQQYKVADIDPHNYDIFETRYQQYVAKPSHTGEKWSVKFGARSAPVSPKDTSDMDTDEGQLITQQVLQTVLEHERKRQKARDYKGLGLKQTSYMKKFFQNRLSYLVLLSLFLVKQKKT